jgi:hypothetical protein
MAGYTYTDMKNFLKTGKDKTTKNRVSAVRDVLVRGPSSKIAHYYLWGNKIATLNLGTRTLKLFTQGYHTKTTKDRLNKILPRGSVIQRQMKWFYSYQGKQKAFVEGMSMGI